MSFQTRGQNFAHGPLSRLGGRRAAAFHSPVQEPRVREAGGLRARVRCLGIKPVPSDPKLQPRPPQAITTTSPPIPKQTGFSWLRRRGQRSPRNFTQEKAQLGHVVLDEANHLQLAEGQQLLARVYDLTLWGHRQGQQQGQHSGGRHTPRHISERPARAPGSSSLTQPLFF